MINSPGMFRRTLLAIVLLATIRATGHTQDSKDLESIPSRKFPEEVRQKAFELGRSLVSAWENKTVAPDVAETMDAFHQRMKWLMTYRKTEWPYEYNYWVTHHGLEA